MLSWEFVYNNWWIVPGTEGRGGELDATGRHYLTSVDILLVVLFVVLVVCPWAFALSHAAPTVLLSGGWATIIQVCLFKSLGLHSAELAAVTLGILLP